MEVYQKIRVLRGDYLMEINILNNRSCYIPGRVNIGIWKDGEGGCYLIDSGGDESSGRKLFRLLQENSLTLKGIINTHSNADHIGGNAYLQKKTSCVIMASSIERTIIENPVLEPLILWGAYPFSGIQTKFLQAVPSVVGTELTRGQVVPNTDLTVIDLPGHFINMIGLLSSDGVCYIADSVFSEEIINKYRFIVTFDVEATLSTLDKLETIEASWFVPCHAEAIKEDITPIVEVNRKGILSLNDAVLHSCSDPHSREEVLAHLAATWNIDMNPVQYVLNLSTISAHLAFLEKRGLVETWVEKGFLLWRKKI